MENGGEGTGPQRPVMRVYGRNRPLPSLPAHSLSLFWGRRGDPRKSLHQVPEASRGSVNSPVILACSRPSPKGIAPRIPFTSPSASPHVESMWPRPPVFTLCLGPFCPTTYHNLGPGVGCEQGGSAGSATYSLGAYPPGEYSLTLLVSTAFGGLTQQVPVSVRAAPARRGRGRGQPGPGGWPAR